jgi:hypothetical protein
MRRDHIDALGDVEAGRIGIDDEGADAARARLLAGAREHDVEVGDAAVGNPGLFAVEHVVVAVPRRRACMAATSDPACGSDSANAAIASPRATRGRYSACFFAAEQADGAGAQSLHGEGEIGQAVVARQRFADQADGARVDASPRRRAPCPPIACLSQPPSPSWRTSWRQAASTSA